MSDPIAALLELVSRDHSGRQPGCAICAALAALATPPAPTEDATLDASVTDTRARTVTLPQRTYEAMVARIADLESRVSAPTEDATLDALVATLKRDDLCDETEGEHHTDEYIASFLVAFDVEMQARAAVAANVLARVSAPITEHKHIWKLDDPTGMGSMDSHCVAPGHPTEPRDPGRKRGY